MPIRWRLTLWFSVILCAILVLTGVVIHTILQHNLYSEVDDHLRLHTIEAEDVFNTADDPTPADYNAICSCVPATVDDFGSPGIYVRLIDQQGNVVGQSDNLGGLDLPESPSLLEQGLAGKVAFDTIEAPNGTRVRVMASPLQFRNGVLLLELGQSLQPVDAAMAQVMWALLGSILAALALAIASSGILIRRALAPVVGITNTARSIEASSDLGRRVGYTGPKDEIGQLATTFDHMIERLEKAFEAHKHFIADASHDLRSPLTVLRGNLDLLKRNLGEEDRKESLRAMEAEAHKMSKIVDDLILLAEVESGQLERTESVALKEVLMEGYERGRQLAGKHNVVLGRQESISVPGDAHRLKRLLGNLVDNAIRYTPEGGTITLSLFRDDGWARLEVTDDGIGIAPEHLPHIFERFYMADKARSRSAGGSGLGLAIVKAIAEHHGGKVTAASEPGKGSTFTTWLKL
jgi:two-component system OmpR family sensor kinase